MTRTTAACSIATGNQLPTTRSAATISALLPVFVAMVSVAAKPGDALGAPPSGYPYRFQVSGTTYTNVVVTNAMIYWDESQSGFITPDNELLAVFGNATNNNWLSAHYWWPIGSSTNWPPIQDTGYVNRWYITALDFGIGTETEPTWYAFAAGLACGTGFMIFATILRELLLALHFLDRL